MYRQTPDSRSFYRFDDSAREIVVQRHDTPSPWVNYLSNGSLHAFVSQAGGGSLWWRSPLNFRISRYRSWIAPVDSPGFALYVREADGSAWSPTFLPTETALDSWEARHAPGRSTFTARKGNKSVSLSLFIAPDAETLVWDIALTNHGDAPAVFDLFGYVEYGLLEYVEEAKWGYYIRNMFKTWYDEANQAELYLYHHQAHPRLRDIPLVYFTANRPVASHSGDRQEFLGAYRTERNPLGVERGHCGNGGIWCGDPCGAIQVPVTVAAGATEPVAFFLGCIPGAMGAFDEARNKRLPEQVAKLRAPEFVPQQRAKLDGWWREHLDVLTCALPDADVERQVKTWTPIQCVQTGRYSRSYSPTASGIRGMGYRDTAQDMLAIAYRRPDWASREFITLLRHQFQDGHAVHTYFPEDKTAPWRTVHSDDHLWLPILAYALVSETGNLKLLSEKAPFLAEDGMSAGPEATVWEHLLAALDFTDSHLGVHGLPLTLKSDWNDVIGRFARAGKGESVFAAQQYVYCLRRMIPLALALGDEAAAAKLQKRLDTQTAAILRHCWDGGWWVRCFDDDGTAIGSHQRTHGQIFLNSQSWSVLSGVGSSEQQRNAMDAVSRLLDTERGIKKIHPSFPTFPEDMDAFVGYSLGCAENGAIFCHANTWAVIAEALLGNPDRAWKYFRQLLPHLALQKAGIERYQAEPYAYPSLVTGPENPRFGWANVSQVTGTAAWMELAGTQYLLGLRPELEGLRVDPCIPRDWKGFTASRLYRGCRVDVSVKNPGSKGCGVRGLTVDGKAVPGVHVPPALVQGKSRVAVEVTLG